MERWPRRLTVGRIMAAVALLALILGAGLFIRENGDIERALVAHHLHQLGDPDPAIRADAADDLSRDAPLSFAPVLRALAGSLLGDPDAATRRVAARSLASALARAAHAPSRPSTAQAVRPGGRAPLDPLGSEPAEADALRALVRALDDPRPEVGQAAVAALGNLFDSRLGFADGLDRAAIPALMRLLDAPDGARRGAAIGTLARIDDPPAEGRDRALRMLRADPDPDARVRAISALGRGWPTVDLYPLLLDLSAHAATEGERSAARLALGSLPQPPAGMAPLLLDWIEAEPIAGVRSADVGWFPSHPAGDPRLLDRIGRMGPPARPHLGRLQALAERRLAERGVASWAEVVDAMARIDPYAPESQAMLPRVGEMVGKPDPTARWFRERPDWSLLGRFGPAAAPLVPAFRDHLRSRDAAERRAAAGLLGRIGAPAVGALPEIEALDRAALGTDPEIRRARNALRRLAPPPDRQAPGEGP